MITIAPKAAERAKILLAKMGRPNLRIRVLAGGCSGLEYKIEPADAPTADDIVFEQDGFKLLVDRQSVLYVAGSELTLEGDMMRQSFRLKNPNAVGTCSCGESFTVAGDEHPPVPCGTGPCH